MRNIEECIKNKVIREFQGRYYYFDKNGIYRSASFERLKKLDVKYRPVNVADCEDVFLWCGINVQNVILTRKAICRLKLGDTIELLDKYLSTTTFEKHEKPQGVERFVTKIGKIAFHRMPENVKKTTFDYIFVEVNIVSQWEIDRLSYIQKHKNEIFQMVISKLEANREFRAFGVPSSFLKVSRLTLKRNSVLEFLLELREL